MQRFEAIGRTGKDVETRRLEDGTPVSKVSIAISERYKDKQGNQQESTQWVDLVFWRGLAEVAEKYVKKGDLIFIAGKLKTRKYEKDGQTKYFTEIHVNDLEMLGGKKGDSGYFPKEEKANGQQSRGNTPVGANTATNDAPADDLPF